MAYRKCTCYSCGKIDTQPNMNRRTIQVDSGSSQAGLSGRAVATSMLFNSKKGGNQVANWITGNTKRNYKRNREVWLCDSCAGTIKLPSKGIGGFVVKTLSVVTKVALGILILGFIVIISGG